METIEAIENIGQVFHICKTHMATLRRFKLTIGANVLRLNHVTQIDTMFIHNRPILHMVDTETHIFAASILRSQSTK